MGDVVFVVGPPGKVTPQHRESTQELTEEISRAGPDRRHEIVAVKFNIVPVRPADDGSMDLGCARGHYGHAKPPQRNHEQCRDHQPLEPLCC